MAITLGAVTLPDGLRWVDEYQWGGGVQAEIGYSVTGALIIEESAKQAGRPITLEGDESSAWVTRATLDALATLAGTLGATHTLTLHDARQFTVAFSRGGAPFDAELLAPVANPVAATWYTLRALRLIVVA